MRTVMENIPHAEKMIQRGDPRIETYRSDVVMRGDPAAVYHVSDVRELREIIMFCNANGIPTTFCGSRTSLTGSSVAEGGLLVATERMNKILDIDVKGDRAIVIAEPGIVLAEFQDALAERGLFYPPDPTSRREARLGATVATNATGEDSLLYGSTRCHVRGLKVLLADGTELELSRPKGSRPSMEKNRAGYYLDGDLIDLFIGSEGTLGFITQVTVDVIQHPLPHFAGMAFFPSLQSALQFVTFQRASGRIAPRALELMDENAIALMQTHGKCVPIPASAKAALYFKQEYQSNHHQAQVIDAWYDLLRDHLRDDAPSLLEATIVALDQSQHTLLRELRHHIPSTINERARQYQAAGGGKVGTDWWVPVEHIEEAIHRALADSERYGLVPYVFGHIGNGHPHINTIARSGVEKQTVLKAVIRQCERAVQWGGGVSGEHGIGKTKRDLLHIQHSLETINRMQEIKQRYDPRWIFGRNNILLYPVDTPHSR